MAIADIVGNLSLLKMASSNSDLHGNAPDTSAAALLLIDVISDLEFEQGDKLLNFALPTAQNILAVKKSARALGIPVIYVNDNFGRWRSDFAAQVRHCLEEHVRGRAIAELLRPDEQDYFVLKPKHSGFFSTCLDILLTHLGAKKLILTGWSANNCVLFTANDAYLRDFELLIPADCVCSLTEQDTQAALVQMEQVLKAHIRPSALLDLAALALA